MHKRAALIVFLVLLIDQSVKFAVKLNMFLGEEVRVMGDWFIIHFTENNGMAFGMELAGDYGKLLLTSFRLLLVCGMVWYLRKLILSNMHKGLIASVALILGGAIGNILDSIFYGVIFGDSHFETATLFPPDGGYSGWLHGKVVDMFYFPIMSGHFPNWFPIWGGEDFIFFRPVFNIADAAISIGIAIIIIYQKRFWPDEKPALDLASEDQDNPISPEVATTPNDTKGS